ncbi:MAG: hypothetical protein QM774_14375 [Gordonia sp. (in: high G+C Gram-positive bacteria)]|uniref:hypothetical protein n=1 Tax=Gordonia sp. (in: high G+C Gram-positive bacteria) TaxID=84139 RepID=UPI0039E66307
MTDSESAAPALRGTPVPPLLRGAGALVGVEGVAGLVVAVIYVIRGIGGHHESYINSYGSAAWFAVCGAALLAAGSALSRGRRWGRGVGVFAQLMLGVVAWTLLTGSHQPVWGTLLAVVVVLALVLMFAPQSTNWLYDNDLPPDA